MKIVAHSMRNRSGEIDLVGVVDRTIVFIEVKTRTTADHGAGHEAVDDEKQRRIARAALEYMKTHGLLNCSVRFDVVSLIWSSDQALPEIEHYPAAFSAPGDFQMLS